MFRFFRRHAHGKQAIERAIRATFERIQDESYRIQDVRWIHVAADCALCTYRFVWSGVIDGVASQGGGRGTSLLVASANGWKVKHEHLGPDAR